MSLHKKRFATTIGISIVALLGSLGATSPARAATTSGCDVAKGSVYISTRGVHVRAGAFNMEQRWCWDGLRITHVYPPTTWGSITATGRTLGVSYEGVSTRTKYFFMPQNGGHWGYFDEIQAKFNYCPPRVVCFPAFLPRIRFELFGDGVNHVS